MKARRHAATMAVVTGLESYHHKLELAQNALAARQAAHRALAEAQRYSADLLRHAEALERMAVDL